MAMLTPKWAFPLTVFLTVITAPSLIIQSYLMVDRIIYLITPFELLPAMEGYCTAAQVTARTCNSEKDGRTILNEKCLEFLYYMLGLAALNAVCFTYRHILTETIANQLVYDIRANLYKHFMRQDLGFYDQRENTSSVLVATMAEQTDKVQ